MGLLDQILRGGVGAAGRGVGTAGGGSGRVIMALLPIVVQLFANRQRGGASPRVPGGLGGMLEQFRRKGYAQQADSWVGTGANQPLPPQALSDVLGDQELDEIASQAGVSPEEARTGLSELLPEVVDRLTPDGQLPDDERLEDGVAEFERQFARSSE
jgi:uncharacterized protein YidB (DUF937 family)